MRERQRLQYLFYSGIAAFVLFLCINYSVAHHNISRLSNVAELINIAGRQRMLSQQIQLLTTQLANPDLHTTADRNKLRQALKEAAIEMRYAQSTLNGDLSQSPDNIDAYWLIHIYNQHNQPLIELTKKFTDLALEISYSERVTPAQQQALTAIADQNFIELLDIAPTRLQAEAEATLALQNRVAIGLFTGAISVLIFFAYIVFRPTLRHVDLSLAAGEHAKLLETVISSANDAIFLIDAPPNSALARITYVNDAFLQLTGYHREEIIGQSPSLLNGPETSQATIEEMQHAIKSRQLFSGEIVNYGKTGEPYWLEISVVPIRNQHGEITNFATIERDITARKKAEGMYDDILNQLKRANQRNEAIANDLAESLHQAELANQAKSDFLANMSHELRTPMNGVLGMAHLLSDTPLDEEQRELVGTINGSAETLLVLLNDILDLSKIEARALTLESIPYNLSEILQSCVNLMRPLATEKQLILDMDIGKNVPTYIWGDPGRTRQIITNLLGNAVKFTEAGQVRVSIHRRRTESADILYLDVQDSGIGIPSDKLDKIFDKFTQADHSVTRKYGGTGLGLAITRNLVELMGGEIGVRSTEGQGSTFWITIPCVPASEDDAVNYGAAVWDNTDQDHQITPLRQARALIVEDYPVNQVFAEKLLRKMGFVSIDLAENGQEALSLISICHYDVIFMDCQMPVMDGYETTIRIRLQENDSGLHTPIIAMTANAMVGDEEKCMKAGMDAYLSKPLNPAKLRAKLEQWFSFEDESYAQSPSAPVAITPAPRAVNSCPIDLQHLGLFTDGDKDEEKELGLLFCSQAEESMVALESALNQGDSEGWRKNAHKLKGSSANLGANTLSELCKQAEHNAASLGVEGDIMLADIRMELNRVRDYFEIPANI